MIKRETSVCFFFLMFFGYLLISQSKTVVSVWECGSPSSSQVYRHGGDHMETPLMRCGKIREIRLIANFWIPFIDARWQRDENLHYTKLTRNFPIVRFTYTKLTRNFRKQFAPNFILHEFAAIQTSQHTDLKEKTKGLFTFHLNGKYHPWGLINDMQMSIYMIWSTGMHCPIQFTLSNTKVIGDPPTLPSE